MMSKKAPARLNNPAFKSSQMQDSGFTDLWKRINPGFQTKGMRLHETYKSVTEIRCPLYTVAN